MCIFALVLSGAYWFQVMAGDAGWRTWVLAIAWLVMSILWLVIYRQERRGSPAT